MRTLKPQQTNSSTSPYGTLEQLQAIRSPVRQEILDHIYANGPATIAVIAALLSVSPESLYFHIQALVRVGTDAGLLVNMLEVMNPPLVLVNQAPRAGSPGGAP